MTDTLLTLLFLSYQLATCYIYQNKDYNLIIKHPDNVSRAKINTNQYLVCR